MRISILVFDSRFYIVRFNKDGSTAGAMELLYDCQASDDILITIFDGHLDRPLVSYGIAEGFLPLPALKRAVRKGWNGSSGS